MSIPYHLCIRPSPSVKVVNKPKPTVWECSYCKSIHDIKVHKCDSCGASKENPNVLD